MINKIDELRRFLMTNKIFFDVLFVGIISTTGIFISIKANNINKYQTIIAEKQYSPHLDIINHQVYNESTQKYSEDEILIINQGKDLREFKTETAVFYDAECLDANMVKKKKLIPILGYYSRYSTTGQGTGKLMSISGYQNNLKYATLSREITNFVNKNKNNIYVINVQVLKYVKVSYVDIFEKSHNEYYKLNIGQPDVLGESEGEDIFKKYKDSTKVDIDDLNIQEFTKILNE